MTRHERRNVRLDRGAERHELDRPQPLGVVLDVRQVVVGIGERIAVPGEMLAARGEPRALQFLDNRDTELRDSLGRLRPGRDRRSRCSSGW